MTEIAEFAGLPLSTTHRLVSQIAGGGLLERGDKTIALVSVDLVGALGDVQREVAARVGDLRLNDETVLLLGSQTHAGPDMMINTTSTPTLANGDPTADVKAFLADRIALSIRRAHRNLRPAALGWGSAIVPDASDNRSIEAHLGQDVRSVVAGM